MIDKIKIKMAIQILKDAQEQAEEKTKGLDGVHKYIKKYAILDVMILKAITTLETKISKDGDN